VTPIIFEEDTPWQVLLDLCHRKADKLGVEADRTHKRDRLPQQAGIRNASTDLCYFSVTLHALRALFIASPSTRTVVLPEAGDACSGMKEVLLACCNMLRRVDVMLPSTGKRIAPKTAWKDVNIKHRAAGSLYLFLLTLVGLYMGDTDAAITQLRSVMYLMTKDIGNGHRDAFHHDMEANYRDISVRIPSCRGVSYRTIHVASYYPADQHFSRPSLTITHRLIALLRCRNYTNS
jgi:hypothetical protein